MALASCATHSSPPVHPERPPPEVCAAVQPEPALPAGAGIVQPVTDEERAATSATLTWVGQVLDWGRALAARAQKTVSWCPP